MPFALTLTMHYEDRNRDLQTTLTMGTGEPHLEVKREPTTEEQKKERKLAELRAVRRLLGEIHGTNTERFGRNN